MKDKVYFSTKTNLVVDQSQVRNLSTTDLPIFLDVLKSADKPIVYLPIINRKPLSTYLKELDKEGTKELLEIFYPDVDITILKAAYERKFKAAKDFDTLLEVTIKEVNKKLTYVMVDTTESIEKYYFTATTIRRERGQGYSITFKQLQKLWNKARPYWAGMAEQPAQEYTRFSGYGEYPRFAVDRINIGCQTLWRWELEQIAQREGWSFDVA